MKSVIVVASVLAVVSVIAPRPAAACGGCFVPPSESTVVSGHRMALSVSPTQTVLWDQIQYTGDPADFAWVLPVKKGAVVEVAGDAWFEMLESATTTTVVAPRVTCESSSGGCGFGASNDEFGGDAPSGGNAPPVQVLHEGTVGPYDTVTLATDTPGALNDWLDDNGYGVDESTQPVIDAYVEEGFDFIALRLQPNAGVAQMTPVRVVTPGASPTLPLRMVAAGTGAQVPIVLFVIGEGRWQPANFPTATIAIDLLAWDFRSSESNYGRLREEALSREGGRSWMTTMALPDVLFGFFGSDPNTFEPLTFAQAYANQALANGEITEACEIADLGGEPREVQDPCPPGVEPGDPSCVPVPSDAVDADLLRCDGLDDLATALIGMHPKDVWVTRLEANLPRAALDADLDLEAADIQAQVQPTLTARVAVHAEDFCPAVSPYLVTPEDAQRLRLFGLAAMLAALLAAVARRQARPSSAVA